jgi:hypothetical protein
MRQKEVFEIFEDSVLEKVDDSRIKMSAYWKEKIEKQNSNIDLLMDFDGITGNN